VDRGRPHVHEQLRFTRKISRSVERALAAEAIELKQQVDFFGARKQRSGRVQLGTLGPSRESLIAENSVGRDIDNRLVDRTHLSFQHQIEQPLPAATRRDTLGKVGVLAGLFERSAQLGLGRTGRVAKRSRRTDRQRCSPPQIRIADAQPGFRKTLAEFLHQNRKLAPVEFGLVGPAVHEYDDFVPPRLTRHDHVADAEAIADQVCDLRTQGVRCTFVRLTPEAAFDLVQRRGVDQDQPHRAALLEVHRDIGQRFPETRDPVHSEQISGLRFQYEPLAHASPIGILARHPE
jgi:hypothetical protein